ncbi:MAG: hypothetical protein Q8R37_01190 [Nanoarchaeota archaeon]|nr:hypothetical protein [Nanoarchaeota archaeon]
MTFEWEKYTEPEKFFEWEKNYTERWVFDFPFQHRGKIVDYKININSFPASEEVRTYFSKYHGKIDACLWIYFFQWANNHLDKYVLNSPFQANFLEGKFKWGYYPLNKRVDYKKMDVVTTKSYQKWTKAFNRYFHPAFSDSMLQQIITYSDLPEKQKQSLQELICPKGSLSLYLENTAGALSTLENKLSLIPE